MQSLPMAHPSPRLQGWQVPPQSRSVSLPFMTLSVQLGAWQTPIAHTPLAHCVLLLHCTQTPFPSQTFPPPSLQTESIGRFTCCGTPPEQTSLVHPFPSLGTSVSSISIFVPPAPSQTFRLQSPGACVDVGVPGG